MADQHTTEVRPQQERLKAVKTNKPNKAKSNHVQPKDTQIKLMVNHITKIAEATTIGGKITALR
jgi:hypothetical protein